MVVSGDEEKSDAVVSAVMEDGRATVALAGEIDIANSARLRACLAGCVMQRCTDVVVDMSQVTFMDSSGLGSLVATAKALGSCGGQLTVRNPRELVKRVFLITGADRLIRLEPSDDESESRLGGSATRHSSLGGGS